MTETVRRERVIMAMLRSYRDVCDQGEIGAGADRSDDRILLMNPLWRQGTYAELYRCLYVMREDERPLYWHLAERFLRSRRRQVRNYCPVCERPADSIHTHSVGGLRQQFRPQDVVLEVWHPRVDPVKVIHGVQWVSAEHRGEPFLPVELSHLIAA